jgi:hypothetical protein
MSHTRKCSKSINKTLQINLNRYSLGAWEYQALILLVYIFLRAFQAFFLQRLAPKEAVPPF